MTMAPETTIILAVLAKATLLLGGGLLAVRLLRDGSAATRHLAATLMLGAVLVLPALGFFGPRLEVALPFSFLPEGNAAASVVDAGLLPSSKFPEKADTSWKSVAAAPVASTPATSHAPVPATSLLSSVLTGLLVAWALGAAFVLGRYALGILQTFRWERRGRPVVAAQEETDQLRSVLDITRSVRVLESADVNVPMTSGLFRPVLFVPMGFGSWANERRHVVLLHELAHVKRLDWLALFLAQPAVAIYWFHPLAHALLGRLRDDAERASDDLVLDYGTRPSDYAAHLVALLKTLKPDTPPPTAALSMAGSRFENRVEAILDAGQRRLPPRRFLAAPAGLALAGLIAIVGGLQFTSSVEACDGEKVAKVASQSSCQQAAKACKTAEKREARAVKRAEKSYQRALVGDKKQNSGQTKGYQARKDSKDRSDSAYRVFTQRRDSSSHYSEGMRLHTAGEYNAAIEAFTQSIGADERVAASSYNIACGHALAGRSGDAFDWLDRAAEAGFQIDDYLFKDDDLRSLRGERRFQRLADSVNERRSDQARRLLAELEASGTEDAGKWYSAGMKMHASGAFSEAIEAWERSIEYGHDPAGPTYNVACAHSLAGDRRSALDALERAIELGYRDVNNIEQDSDLDPVREAPRYARILSGVERLELPGNLNDAKTEDWAATAEANAKLVRSDPDNGEGWFNLGFAQLRLGKSGLAAQSFEKAHSLEFRSQVSAYNVACALAMAKDKNGAFKWLERAKDDGFSNWGMLETDPDLASLRGDDRLEAYADLERPSRRLLRKVF
jgi:beta-lactamase regulating signal transducer with metallopeptidase domain